MTEVLLLSNDISAFVQQVPPSRIAAGDYGQITINPIPNLKGVPGSQLWDRQTQASPFFGGADPTTYPVEINRSGKNVFTGHIGSIRNGPSGADIALRSVTQELLERNITFARAEVTPAAAALEILQLFKIPVDIDSFNISDVALNEKGITVRTVSLGDQTLNTVLQALAVAGVARVYSVEGRIRFETYQVRTSDPLITLSDDVSGDLCIWSIPTVETVPKQPIAGYSVKWTGTLTATKGSEEDGPIRQISGTADDIVQIETFQGAVQIGELWFDYLSRQQDRITFDTSAAIGKSLDVGYPVGIDYSKWSAARTIDIQSIDVSRDDRSKITGLTR